MVCRPSLVVTAPFSTTSFSCPCREAASSGVSPLVFVFVWLIAITSPVVLPAEASIMKAAVYFIAAGACSVSDSAGRAITLARPALIFALASISLMRFSWLMRVAPGS